MTSPRVRRGSSCRSAPGSLQPPTGPASEPVVHPVTDAGLSKPHEENPLAEKRTSCASEGAELLATTELPAYVQPPASGDAADTEGQPIDRLATATTLGEPDPDEQRARERSTTVWDRGEKRGSVPPNLTEIGESAFYQCTSLGEITPDVGTPTAAPSVD